LRVIFMGTPDFAVPVLQSVRALGWPVVGVYTAPDKLAGRGRQLRQSPVKEYALAEGLSVYQPERLRTEADIEELLALVPDVLVVAAYGKLLPQPVLEAVPKGPVNVHPSLLPKYRGAAPVAAAVLAGDAVTGVSLMVLDAGMDTGPVLAQREALIGPKERTPELTGRLFLLGAELLRDTLPLYMEGRVNPVPQDESKVVVTSRLRKEDGELDWAKPAAALERQVRAYQPWPGSFTTWRGQRLEILSASVVSQRSQTGPVGQVVALIEAGAPGVITSEGELVLIRVRLEGRHTMGIDEFLKGHTDFTGARLPS
jgi:methionyl-tRNA formyltransferase